MGLSSALASAMTGLRANQAALSIVSSNVANAQTPGYVARRRTRSRSPPATSARACDRPASTASSTSTCRTSCAPRPAAAPTPTRWQHPEAAAECLRHARRRRHARNRAEQFHHARCRRCRRARAASSAQNVVLSARAVAGAAAQRDTQGIQSLRSNVEQDLGISVAAGQRGDAADRATSTPSSRACRRPTPRPRR